MNAIATEPNAADQAQTDPLDLKLMRQTVNQLLDPDAAPDAMPPAASELETLTLQLRGHLHLLMPEVEQIVAGIRQDSIPRYCTQACLGEARMKLAIEPQEGLSAGVAHARRLARVLNALLDHYENLNGTTA